MPFVYNVDSRMAAAALENYATHATPNTEIDAAFWKPGATCTMNLLNLRGQGKGAGLTALSGIALRLKIYPTTAAAGGSAITPKAVDDRHTRAAVSVCAAAATAAGNVTAGTGTLAQAGGISFGASGPGGWVAENPDSMITIEGGAARSLDLFSSSPTASLNYEWFSRIQE